MKSEKMELVRGSGNVFRDLGRENADIEQLKHFWQPRSWRPSIARSWRSGQLTIGRVSPPQTSHAFGTQT